MKAAHDALRRLLAEDATLADDLARLALGSRGDAPVPEVIEGNQPFASLGPERFPAWVLEAGDSSAAPLGPDDDDQGLVIGSHRQGFQAEILLALVWHQQDPARAYQQRVALHDIVARLLLRHPSLDEAVELAWLAGMNNDRQAAHPLHVAQFRVLAHFETRRTP